MSAFKLELYIQKLDWINTVFYSFDFFRVVMQQILRVLISVDYIVNIIKGKNLLLQA
jgi:hypothetical protein